MGIDWTQEELDYLKNNYDKVYISDIATKLCRTNSSIEHKIDRLRINGEINKKRFSKIHFSNEEIDILKDKFPNGGTKEVQRYIKRSKESIMEKAKCLGIKRQMGFRRNKLNLDYLINPNTAQAAYILGLLWADGCIYVGGFMRRITLTLIDTDFSEVANLFNGWYINVINNSKYKTWQVCYMARLYHREFGDFLIENGYYLKSQCSPTKILNKIPENFKHYFFRGLFDGDGCNTTLIDRHVICIAGAYNQNWIDVENLCKQIDSKYKIIQSISKDDNKGSIINISGLNSCYNFMKYIYSGEILGLSRKYNNYVAFCNKYDLVK